MVGDLMIGDSRVLGLIPARQGSKGLPGKNIKMLCGKPVITWTIESARKSRLLDEIVVSTDSQEIADIACAAGAAVPFLRPPDLATDESPTVDTAEHALEFFAKERGQRFDYVALLEPSSPLREDDDVDNMLRKLHASADSFDAIISVGETNTHPASLKRLVGDAVEPFCRDLPKTARRQDNEPAYFPYGGAYFAKTTTLLAERTFFPARCTYYCLKRYQSYEIDDMHDFIALESIMRFHCGLP